MEIDKNAPAVAREQITIQAPIEKVWQLQSDIQHWNTWQPDISNVTVSGDLKTGTTFKWKAQGLTITSTLEVVEPPVQIGWTGVAMGMKAIHNWSFEQHDDHTHVIVEESLSGWLTRLMCLFDKNFLQKSMVKSLAVLKQQAEKSA